MHDRDRKLLSRARRAYECGRLIVAPSGPRSLRWPWSASLLSSEPRTQLPSSPVGRSFSRQASARSMGECSEAPPTSYCWLVLRPSSGYWPFGSDEAARKPSASKCASSLA